MSELINSINFKLSSDVVDKCKFDKNEELLGHDKQINDAINQYAIAESKFIDITNKCNDLKNIAEKACHEYKNALQERKNKDLLFAAATRTKDRIKLSFLNETTETIKRKYEEFEHKCKKDAIDKYKEQIANNNIEHENKKRKTSGD